MVVQAQLYGTFFGAQHLQVNNAKTWPRHAHTDWGRGFRIDVSMSSTSTTSPARLSPSTSADSCSSFIEGGGEGEAVGLPPRGDSRRETDRLPCMGGGEVAGAWSKYEREFVSIQPTDPPV